MTDMLKACGMKPGNGYFDLELRPNRSLEKRRFMQMIAAVAVIFFVMGLRFLFLGAWPIIPFMIVDVALFVWAMRASYQSGRACEWLRLDERRGLELLRQSPRGRIDALRLDALQTRVELEKLPMEQNRLWLKDGRGRHLLGGFLSPPERVEVARVIEDGLSRYRRAGRARLSGQ